MDLLAVSVHGQTLEMHRQKDQIMTTNRPSCLTGRESSVRVNFKGLRVRVSCNTSTLNQMVNQSLTLSSCNVPYDVL